MWLFLKGRAEICLTIISLPQSFTDYLNFLCCEANVGSRVKSFVPVLSQESYGNAKLGETFVHLKTDISLLEAKLLELSVRVVFLVSTLSVDLERSSDFLGPNKVE